MFESPFPHYGPLPPELVRGRDELVAELIERVTARRPTVLVAPRRFGKTSVIGRVAAELVDTTTVVVVDLYEIRSWADLANRLDGALSSVTGTARRAMDRIAATLELNLGVVKATLSRRGAPAADAVAEALVDVLITHAARSPTLLVLDEFSSIDRIDGAAGMLRTKLQHHYGGIGLLFAGSKPSTMRMLFESTDQPFYGQADLLDVPLLTLAALTDIVEAGFAGSPPPGLAAEIHAFTLGHPQRSMQLADAAWVVQQDRTESGAAWEMALHRVRTATAGSHEVRYAELPAPEQALLRVVASGGAPYGQDGERAGLGASSVAGAGRRLVDRGLITNQRDQVVDPLFADWIRTRF